MIDGLKPYPAMKDSGVPWLGEVPEHWEVRRLKHVCAMRSGDGITAEAINADGDYPVYGGNGRRGFTSSFTHDGEFPLVGRQGALCGNVHLARGQFWASEHAVVASPESGVSPSFLAQALRILDLRQYSIAAAQPGLAVERILTLPAPLPPLPEQAAIVRFLDHADRRIRRYIRDKQKLIKLLEEQKQAIIHRAVTRGLDPNVRLKSSGVEWLGDVPEHWEVTRLKNVAAVQTGLTLGKDYRSAKTKRYPYLRVANVQTGRVDLRTVKEVEVPEAEARRSMLRAGDVLMTEGGDIDKLGRGCVWSGEIAECLHQNHVFAVRCGLRLLPAFLAGLMASNHGRAYFQTTAKQTTNLAATNSTTLRAFPLVLPDVAEQEHVLSWIATETEALVRAAADADREIALLREYRTRLIADVVTGKLDVREAAARLPDEVPEAETEDDLDEVAEGDDAAGPESDIDTEPENEAA